MSAIVSCCLACVQAPHDRASMVILTTLTSNAQQLITAVSNADTVHALVSQDYLIRSACVFVRNGTCTEQSPCYTPYVIKVDTCDTHPAVEGAMSLVWICKSVS